MTLGRRDIAQRQYFDSKNRSADPHRRAFWHTGIGIWQLDDNGMGWDMPADKRISSDDSAKRVAEEMARLWMDAKRKGTTFPGDLRTAAWKPWRGCNELRNGRCEEIFKAIYIRARPGKPDSLNLRLVDKVTRFGGAVWRTCNWQGKTGTFPCLVVDPSRAEGKAGGWFSTFNNGSYYRDGSPTTPSPLTATMVVVPTDTVEYRFFLREHGHAVDIQAYRLLTRRRPQTITWKLERGICIEGNCGTATPFPNDLGPLRPSLPRRIMPK
jgi:hypothetical protein